jgi:hypothetical protein
MPKTRTDSSVLSARRRLRDSIKRDNERVDHRMRAAARRDMEALSNNDNQYTKARKVNDSVVHATAKLASVVAASMDVRVPINIKSSSQTSGITDFKSIKISINPNAYDLNDYTQVMRLLKLTKGVLYHEIGHCKFTVPLADILTSAGVDKETVNKISAFKVSKAWNLLEDQRMECAMVRYSPIMMNYFTVIILDHVISKPEMSWPFVAGRTYLDKRLLDKFRLLSSAYCNDVLYEPTLIRDTSRVVAKYKRAASAKEMYDAIIEMVDIIERWQKAGVDIPDGVDTHGGVFDKSGNDEEVTNDKISSSASEQDDKDESSEDEPQQDGGLQNSDEQGEDEGSSGGDTGFDKDEPTDGSGHSSAGDEKSDNRQEQAVDDDTYVPGKGASTDEESGKTLREIVDEVRDEVLTTTLEDERDAKEFLSVVNEEQGRSLTHTSAVTTMDDHQLEDANDIRNNMLRVLEPLATQVEPSWRFRQETGILDAVSYVTRDPGDTDFWVGLDDDGQQGYDVAVSVILDVSYSMGNACYDLGSVALGVRQACDEIDVPCTVSVFDDASNILWAADEQPTEVFAHANGGTYPLNALLDLDNQMMNKSRHLVIVLTDGIWPEDIKDLSTFSRPGRYIIGVGYDKYYPHGIKSALEDLNPNEAYGIRNVRELPDVITSAISAYFA